MIPELGQFALILALLCGVMQASLPLIGAWRRDVPMMRVAINGALMSFALVAAAFIALVIAHVGDDFSVLNVFMNSHTQKPLLYKVTGVWGNHEGSMLLWVLLLTGFGAVMALRLRGVPLEVKARALAMQGLLGCGFLAFILATSDPFARLAVRLHEGRDLNPLLQDPALALHPPLLYFGYVGFSSVFSLAAAQLMSDWVIVPWARWVRPYVLASWAALTGGIALGSWWAYYELGWGGWWFWDPVENAALMPWLLGTALVHSVMATWHRAALARWTILLGILTFALSLIGTFLVRSGLLTSVHTFASDPSRGVFMLSLLVAAIGGALVLYALRAPRLAGSPMFAAVSRESAVLLNNLFLTVACATVFVGTLYPMLLDALGGGIVSVGAPYFNITVLPLLAVVALCMVAGPLLKWREDNFAALKAQLRIVMFVCVGVIALALYLTGARNVLGVLALAVAVWVMGGSVIYARKKGWRAPATLTHGGMAICILGMAGSAFSTQYQAVVAPHHRAALGPYNIEFSERQEFQGPNYAAERGVFYLYRDDDYIATLTPERRYYPSQQMPLSDVSIRSNLLRDLYLVMDAPEADGAEARPVRLQINPLVDFIWLGCAVMALGAALQLLPKPRKVWEAPDAEDVMEGRA